MLKTALDELLNCTGSTLLSVRLEVSDEAPISSCLAPLPCSCLFMITTTTVTASLACCSVKVSGYLHNRSVLCSSLAIYFVQLLPISVKGRNQGWTLAGSTALSSQNMFHFMKAFHAHLQCCNNEQLCKDRSPPFPPYNSSTIEISWTDWLQVETKQQKQQKQQTQQTQQKQQTQYKKDRTPFFATVIMSCLLLSFSLSLYFHSFVFFSLSIFILLSFSLPPCILCLSSFTAASSNFNNSFSFASALWGVKLESRFSALSDVAFPSFDLLTTNFTEGDTLCQRHVQRSLSPRATRRSTRATLTVPWNAIRKQWKRFVSLFFGCHRGRTLLKSGRQLLFSRMYVHWIGEKAGSRHVVAVQCDWSVQCPKYSAVYDRCAKMYHLRKNYMQAVRGTCVSISVCFYQCMFMCLSMCTCLSLCVCMCVWCVCFVCFVCVCVFSYTYWVRCVLCACGRVRFRTNVNAFFMFVWRSSNNW